MSINDRFRQNVRTFYYWLGSTVLLGAAPLVAGRLIEHDTTISRAAGVVMGVGGMVPWLWVLTVIVLRGDEYVRRLHLVAIAIAAGASFIGVALLGWLVRADFIGPPDLMAMWVGMLVIWVIALVGAQRYFERAQ